MSAAERLARIRGIPTVETLAAVLPDEAPTCTHGHPHTPANTYRHATGYRHCRTCRRQGARRRRAQARRRAVLLDAASVHPAPTPSSPAAAGQGALDLTQGA